MTESLWVVAFLSLSLPSGYELTGSSTEKVVRDVFKAKSEFRSWRSPDGKTLMLSSWAPRPLRDGGPAVIVNSSPIEIAGQTAELLEASLFMGMKQDVLATHLKFSNPESTVLVYGKGYSKEEFKALLRNADIRPVP